MAVREGMVIMRIYKCRTNHIDTPLGYGMERAVVSWISESEQSKKQIGAQIVVALDSDMKQIIYQSNPEENPDSTGVELPIELKPRTVYYWTVKVWGDGGNSAVSEVNSFETGKREEELLGSWITVPWREKKNAPYVRKIFSAVGPVKKARLYVAGLGVYWLEINGKRVGEEYFAPGCTAVDRWVQIYTYDVTDYLQEGENVLGFLMGNGWAKGRMGAEPSVHTRSYINDYFLKAELRLEYADGKEQILTTDNSWKCTLSPILADDFYDGEVFDSRIKISDWSMASCCDATWQNMVYINMVPLGKLEDRLSLPVLIKEMLKPKEILHTPKGELVLDMGQNMTGWIRMHVHETADTKIKLTYGEILQNDCFYRENLRTARAEYVYISDGTEQVVEPHFSFYGFRYVKVEGMSEPLEPNDFIGCVVYSDLSETGEIETSDPRINRLFLNTKWSQKDNFLDVPTDCPQRDERMGWTGDAQVFCKTACYNMETYAFYTKYLHDLWREQQKNQGMVSHVVPSFLTYPSHESSFWQGGSCVWGDAAVIMPWTMYLHYGDLEILRRQYDSMKAWVDWIAGSHVNEDGLWADGFHFGDWLSLDAPDPGSCRGGTDRTYIASAYLKNSSELLAKAAMVLGKTTDAVYYQKISDQAKEGIRKTYYAKDGNVLEKTQTAHVLALAMNLAEEEHRPVVAKGLFELLKETDMHLRTGFVGTPFLCKVLSEAGYSDVAYELLFKDDYPSWLYEVDMGATTIWERWNSVLPDGSISGTGMNSLNHYAYGSISQWMYENMCGLTLKEAGFKSFYINPEYTERFSFVNMKYESPKGTIEIRWEQEGKDQYKLYVKVPFDTTAYVAIPGKKGEIRELDSGEFWM